MNGNMNVVKWDNNQMPLVWQDSSNRLYAKDNFGAFVEIDMNGNPVQQHQQQFPNQQQQQGQGQPNLTIVKWNNNNMPIVWKDGNNRLYAKDNFGAFVEIDMNGNPVQQHQQQFPNQQHGHMRNNMEIGNTNNIVIPGIGQNAQSSSVDSSYDSFINLDQSSSRTSRRRRRNSQQPADFHIEDTEPVKKVPESSFVDLEDFENVRNIPLLPLTSSDTAELDLVIDEDRKTYNVIVKD